MVKPEKFLRRYNMSNHKDSLVKVLEYLVNEEREKAADLLHTVFVEKAKNHWASLTESDESVEEDIQEEDLDETIDLDDVEEAIDNYDAEDDFLSDIETAEEEIDSEEIYDNEDMDDAENELAMDMEVDMDDDMDDDMGDDDAEEDSDAEEALANVEDAIAELRAAFADIMGDDMGDDDDEDEDDDMEVEGLGEGAELKAVSAKMTNGEDSGAKSPVKAAGNEMGKPHPTDTTVENGGKAPAAKPMNVKGPQDHGARMSAAPAPKREMK